MESDPPADLTGSASVGVINPKIGKRPTCSRASFEPFLFYHAGMRYKIRFLWNATKGHRLAPWRSPYLLWRIETYTGVKMTQIGFLEFWEFIWRERRELWGFLKWTGEMERWVQPKPKSLQGKFSKP